MSEEANFFVVVNVSHSEFEEKKFYDVKLRDVTPEKFGDIDVVNSELLERKLTFGKVLWNNDILKQLEARAREFILSRYQTEELIVEMAEAIKIVKKKNCNVIAKCRAFVLFHTEFRHQFNSGNVIVFDGERVRIINYSVDIFSDISPNQYAIFTNVLVGKTPNDIKLRDDSTIESVPDAIETAVEKLFNHQWRNNNSSCVIGHVISIDEQQLNPNTGRPFENGHYVIITIQEDISEIAATAAMDNISKYRLWHTNCFNGNLNLQGDKVICASFYWFSN
jgi:hypothetical protein